MLEYLLSLFLTLIIEGGVAFAMGFRERKYMIVIVLINIFTHLVLNYLLFILGYVGVDKPLALIVSLEGLVVVAEWRLLVYVFRNPKGRFLMMTLLGNTASFLTGILIF